MSGGAGRRLLSDPFAPADRAGRLALARGYPYPAPAGSYTWVDGRVVPFDPALRAGRTAVLALGSNRAPQQLERKYAGWPAGTAIAAEAVTVGDADIVYSAHLTRYGALPALLTQCAGVAVSTVVLWLDERQLARMHETEGVENYAFAALPAGRVRDGDGRPLGAVHAYLGRRGAFAPHGQPIALAAVAALNRMWPALDQPAALDAARRIAAPDRPLADFIDEAATRPDRRRGYTAALSRVALPAGIT